MCGRYVTPQIAEAERNFLVHLRHWQEYERSYNVAPTGSVPVVRMHDAEREGVLMRWGLIPYFAGGIAPQYSTINATIEKLESAPAWRGPWKRAQRCVLPASGFYEWHVLPDGSKRPYYITCVDQPLFGFAGLWDASVTESGQTMLSCTVITMPANDLLAEIHNAKKRMPAILAPRDVEAWLSGSSAFAHEALKPYPSELMLAHPVSSRVNSPRNDDETLIASMSATVQSAVV